MGDTDDRRPASTADEAAPVASSPEPPAAGDADGSADVRQVLDESRRHLVEQVAEFDAETGDAATIDDNFADSAAVSAEQAELHALAASVREQLDDVERALARLDEGTYGTCEVCGAPIGEPRLEALPATRFCIDHAG